MKVETDLSLDIIREFSAQQHSFVATTLGILGLFTTYVLLLAIALMYLKAGAATRPAVPQPAPQHAGANGAEVFLVEREESAADDDAD